VTLIDEGFMAIPAPSNSAPETLFVKERSVSCDGGDGALGHPRVYLKMDGRDFVECPYCDRQFILTGGAADPR
jgi:uncharacterized Zn-finger protein